MYNEQHNGFNCASIEEQIRYIKSKLSLLKNSGNKKQSKLRDLLNTVVDNFCELNSSYMQSSEKSKFKTYLSGTKYKKIFSHDSKNFFEQLFRNIKSDSENCEILRKNFIDILKLTYDIYKLFNHKKNHESDFNSFINSFTIERAQNASTVSIKEFKSALTKSKEQCLGIREIIERAIAETKKQLAIEIEEIVKQIETKAEIVKAEVEQYNESTTTTKKISVKDTIKIHEPQEYGNNEEYLNSIKNANAILKGNTERLVEIHEEFIERDKQPYLRVNF